MKTILKLTKISKTYPGVKALQNVSLEFREGEIHSIMGENGAGKSTMIKIMSGAIQPDNDGGEIEVDGEIIHHMTPAVSKEKGISVIYQEFTLVPTMSVVENIFLGEKVGGKIIPNFKEMRKRAQAIFDEFGVDIDLDAMVNELTPGKQQLVEIAKALTKNVKIMIMDEPSASISVADVKILFSIIHKLKEKKVTIIYISHRMEEVFELSDRVSILRDGTYIGTQNIQDVDRKQLVKMMVGRELNESYPTRNTPIGETVLETKQLCGNGDYNISFKLRKGEVLGLAGLVGAGRTELAKVIYGAAKCTSGEIYVKGKKVHISSPRQAINLGIGYIPEDRKNEGCFLNFPIDWNISLINLPNMSNGTVISKKRIGDISREYADKLRIKTPSLKQYVKNLSGGNQQKVVVAKTLVAKTDIIIFDEPTRGIDVGAKQEIYQLINELISQGVSIIMISSEMEELMGMSDRILVMSEGRITGELSKTEYSQAKILEMASGI